MNDVMDKSMRSVFVGNNPYEVTEDKLKGIFSEVNFLYYVESGPINWFGYSSW